ncbi:peptidoglycan endopeptidase [Lysinibacillus yapensis]|uniref:Peptidoglycan endopeptidase n=1 Tax=Ureibacillus yapensis TaxID=2304605 RepID=A0A396SE15_9BACL|nr:peptidoglycan endopeptidase [Lysinibacillus yapensis]RHW39953.1 peptidoglycan endopeptidase [Lysinibacillus yapensis]
MRQKNRFLLFSTAVLATSIFAAPIAEASTYTVNKGDTLAKVARENNLTLKQIRDWNGLKSDTIYTGQKLAVQETKLTTSQAKPLKQIIASAKMVEPANSYKVAKGETLTKIAKASNVTVANLKKWNNLKSNAIYVGQVLKLSEGIDDASIKQSPVARKNATSASSTYKVAKGDSLTNIANKHGLTVAQLKNLNNLTSDLIFVGQDIKIIESVDEVEFSTPLNPTKLKNSEQVILEQLAKEKAIASNPARSGQALYANVLELADSLTGTPYVFGGNTPAGFDCSGFVKYVFANAGLEVSRKSSLDYFMNDTTAVQNPVPGDVVFFKNTYIEGISHMGIYLGDGQFIHAGNSGVQISNLSFDYWSSKFVAFKRFNGVS